MDFFLGCREESANHRRCQEIILNLVGSLSGLSGGVASSKFAGVNANAYEDDVAVCYQG